MQTVDNVARRRRYLRRLLVEQLDQFERGSLRLLSNDIDVSVAAIGSARRQIQEFDDLIAGQGRDAAPA